MTKRVRRLTKPLARKMPPMMGISEKNMTLSNYRPSKAAGEGNSPH